MAGVAGIAGLMLALRSPEPPAEPVEAAAPKVESPKPVAAAPTNAVAPKGEKKARAAKPFQRAVTNAVHRRLKPDGTIDHRFDVPPGSYRDERGILRRPGGMRILEAEPKHKVHLNRNEKPRLFKNDAENKIAALLSVESGAIMIGGEVYGKSFVEDFKRSLNEPIEILPTDDDETASIKQSVIEVKQELKQRMDAGEDIAKVMQETRSELQQIGKYRQDLHAEIIKYAHENEGCTENDIVDYVNAANLMLESRGSSQKISVPRGLINRLKAQGRLKE